MQLKGKKELLDHLPDYTDQTLKLIFLRVNLITLLTLVILFILDTIPRLFPSTRWLTIIEPYLPLLGSAITIVGGLRIVHQTWYSKDKLLIQDKKRAYQHASKYLFTGIPIALGGLVHGFMPIIRAPLTIIEIAQPVNPATTQFAQSNIDWLSQRYQLVFGILFILIAILTIFRTIQIFGIDTASLVYVYYPEDSMIIQHEIYSIVRNPLYVSLMIFGIGMIISRFSLYSVGIFIIWWLGMMNHIHNVEDKELINRFGEDFRKYQQNVPALLIRPKNWGKFIRFLIGKPI